MAEERLQKFLAGAGIASRRKAEELILAGRVKVNDRVVTALGTKVDAARDLVTVDGALVSQPETRSYYLLYKPAGCVTTASDPQGRPTALEYLRGVPARLFSVGRLDYDAEGAVLFTDDGELANRLAHPRYGHRRVYLVKVRGDPDPTQLERMLSGVRLEDGPAKALEVAVHEKVERNVWIRVVVGEGRYHLVKRLCEAVGLFVQRLFRPEFGGVTVEGLRPGQYRPLAAAELKAMRAAVGLGPPARGEDAGSPPPLPKVLPRAARRHGHGPPEPPSAARPPRDAREERGRGPSGGGEAGSSAPAWPRQRADAGRGAERGGRGATKGDVSSPGSQQREERGRPGYRGARAAPAQEARERDRRAGGPRAATDAPLATRGRGERVRGERGAAGSTDRKRGGRPQRRGR
jgi:23S rRNA pseudouridine2605 synthase